MHTQKSNFQTMKYFFYILMIAILGWFCFMQLFGANEQNYNDPSKSIIYSGSFYWNKEDGTKQKIKVPGTYEVKPGHTMVLTTTWMVYGHGLCLDAWRIQNPTNPSS